MTRILILKEQHGERYFDVSTEEKLHAVALSVVTGRFGKDSDRSCDIDPGTRPEPPNTGMTEAEVEALPLDNILRQRAIDAYNFYNDHLKEYTTAVAQQAYAAKCIEKKDGRRALVLLAARGAFEGEEYDIQDAEESYTG